MSRSTKPTLAHLRQRIADVDLLGWETDEAFKSIRKNAVQFMTSLNVNHEPQYLKRRLIASWADTQLHLLEKHVAADSKAHIDGIQLVQALVLGLECYLDRSINTGADVAPRRRTHKAWTSQQ